MKARSLILMWLFSSNASLDSALTIAPVPPTTTALSGISAPLSCSLAAPLQTLTPLALNPRIAPQTESNELSQATLISADTPISRHSANDLIGDTSKHAMLADRNTYELAQLNGIIENDLFFNTRDLSRYQDELPDAFKSDLGRLGPGQVWLDVGAGAAEAAGDYLEEKGSADVVAVAVRKPKQSRINELLEKYAGQFKYKEGKYIEDYAPSELPPADIITDVFGPATYSPTPDKVFLKYGELLKPGGRVYTHLNAGNPDEDMSIIGALGEEVPIEFWLGAIRGFRVETATSKSGGLYITLYRTDEPLAVPPLKLIGISSVIPPVRRYRWNSPDEK